MRILHPVGCDFSRMLTVHEVQLHGTGEPVAVAVGCVDESEALSLVRADAVYRDGTRLLAIKRPDVSGAEVLKQMKPPEQVPSIEVTPDELPKIEQAPEPAEPDAGKADGESSPAE